MDHSINPDFKRHRLPEMTVEGYVAGIQKSDRVVLARALTLIESSKKEHKEIARRLVSACMPFSGNSLRVGITGVPGVGKSSFIEASGLSLLDHFNKKIAVLAVDPSSSRQSGSILGDKTRMEALSLDKRAFIRPSPASGSLGGVARKTRESVLLCEAAGYDLILIETVGVGQSETSVYDMVDCFLLLMLAGAGDQLQGIKRGIMEMADLVAITKADGQNEKYAKSARAEYDAAVRMLPLSDHGMTRQVLTCSANTGEGIEAIWEAIFAFQDQSQKSGFFADNRKEQLCKWMQQAFEHELLDSFYSDKESMSLYKTLEKEVRQGLKSPFDAATILIQHHK